MQNLAKVEFSGSTAGRITFARFSANGFCTRKQISADLDPKRLCRSRSRGRLSSKKFGGQPVLLSRVCHGVEIPLIIESGLLGSMEEL